MTRNRVLRCCHRLNLILCTILLWVIRPSDSVIDPETYDNTYSVSSFRYPKSQVRPFDARSIRVDLPQWFSSVSISVESSVSSDYESLIKDFTSTEPTICFRDGSPPVPSILNSSYISSDPISNISFGEIRHSRSVQCYTMQKNFTLKLTNEQILPGVWYIGFSNGIGTAMTQSKMIVRRPAYVFSANISVEGCTTLTMWGENCSKTVYPLSCSRLENQTIQQPFVGVNTLSCATATPFCQVGDSQTVYSLDVLGITEKIIIMDRNFSSVSMAKNDVVVDSVSNLVLLVRYGRIPTATEYDYSHDILLSPKVIKAPKIGRWFIVTLPANSSSELRENMVRDTQSCHSFESHLLTCPMGKSGDNCSQQIFELQTAIRKNSLVFESYFLPTTQDIPLGLHSFHVEALSSNLPNKTDVDRSWTYFIFNIPRGGAGGNLHIRLSSRTKLNYEVYLRFGALPSLNNWDFYYMNRSRNSDNSMFFKLYSQREENIDFYILSIKEGTWSIGLRNTEPANRTSDDHTMMTVSTERCPKDCSDHGKCNSVPDASGLTLSSSCTCDRTHGGIDCGIEIISHKEHIVQSIALIASNAVAALPALWALRKKAFAEWVLFSASGISSGLYHACDVGAWCALSFGVLQFMDFWLSFMAVVSTFVFLTNIDEASKRTIHTIVAILTALMAKSNATSSSNVALVIAIGAIGLLVGWMLEFSTNRRPFSVEWVMNMTARWQTISMWVRNLIKTIVRRFRWGFVLAGLIALAMAAVSWKLESSESYWVWHSLWHVSIYTSSFFFLCSKADDVNGEHSIAMAPAYALTRQDSSQGLT